MSLKTKKILIIVSVILALVFVGLAIYYFFFKEKPTIVPPGAGGEVPIFTGEVTPQAERKLIALTTEAVLGANGGDDNKIVYVAWDGAINKIDFKGQAKEKLGVIAADRIGRAEVSKNGARVLVKQTLASGQNRFVVFDSDKKSLRSLPQNTQTAALSPDGGEVLMLVPGTKSFEKNIISLDSSGKNINIATTKIPDLVLEWPGDKFIALKTKPSGLAFGLLYLLDPKTKKTERIFGSAYGLTVKFSQSNKNLLYSQTQSSGFGLKLAALDLAKKTVKNLNIFTLPEKCAWSQDDRTVYCSVIKTEESYVMPDDYYKGKIESSAEEIVKMNLDTGENKKIISANFDASNLFLSKDETYLFFINKKDGRLYRLTL